MRLVEGGPGDQSQTMFAGNPGRAEPMMWTLRSRNGNALPPLHAGPFSTSVIGFFRAELHHLANWRPFKSMALAPEVKVGELRGQQSQRAAEEAHGGAHRRAKAIIQAMGQPFDFRWARGMFFVMDIRLYFPPRPGFPPSTVQGMGIPDELEQSSVEPLARKVLDARLCAPYMGRVNWTDIESAAREHGLAAPFAGKKRAAKKKKRST